MKSITSSSPAAINSRPEPKKNREAWRLTGGRCWYCGVHLDPGNYHMSHIVPVGRGGKGLRHNRVTSCPSCNCAKGNRTLEEFRLMHVRKENGIPYFWPEQREWLRETLGVTIPEDEPYEFWFERMGLKP